MALSVGWSVGREKMKVVLELMELFSFFFSSFLGKMSWSRTEGGRLEKELAYMRRTLGEGAGSTHQILIQTPSNGQGGSLLSRDALLAHLRAVQAATKVTVEMFDT